MSAPDPERTLNASAVDCTNHFDLDGQTRREGLDFLDDAEAAQRGKIYDRLGN